MRLPARRSLRGWILSLVLLTTGLSLLIASLAMVGQDLERYRRNASLDLATQANIIALSSASALLFDDHAVAERNLQALRARPDVLSAALYRADGTLYADFLRAGATPPPKRWISDPNALRVLGWWLTGRVPDPDHARALEQYLIVTVDHGFNSSTFTSRVIASTGADAAAAVVGAIGALSGPLHGGAPSRALDTLDAIGTADAAEPYVRGLLARGERVMGFGHAVYRTHDPRSVLLRDVARRQGGPLADLAIDVEQTVLRILAETRPDRPLYTNVEYYAGVVMNACGIPRDMFTATFAVSRVIGWCANIAEQAAERRLIRPSAHYVGPVPPAPVPEA